MTEVEIERGPLGMPNWKTKLKEEEATRRRQPLWAPFHSAVYDGDGDVGGRGFILPLYDGRGRRRRRSSQVNQKRICGCPPQLRELVAPPTECHKCQKMSQKLQVKSMVLVHLILQVVRASLA